MARFTTTGGGGEGTPGPQGPAGEDAVLPQDLGTTDNPEFSTIILTSNGATNNITIGDDVILGDGNVANHVVIIGQQDATAGGIVLGTNETEFISTNGTDLSITADNDIVLLPGSNYAYLNMIDVDHRIATMADVTSGTQGDPGPQGDPGEPGADGADALWNFLGAYDGGTSYAIGDVVTYDGQLWYRTHANGGTVGNTPSEGFIWALLAAKGADGADGADGANGDDGTNGTDFGIYYLGNYNASNGYSPNIAVVRGSDGQLYLAKSSGQLGDPVGNTAEWEVWIPKGADGDDGTNGTSLTARGAWTDSENYAINDIVNFEGSSYVCIVGVTAGTDVAPYPQHIGAYWQLLAQGGSSSADIADFVFTNVDASNSSMTITGDKEMTIESGAESDLNVSAGDQLWLTAGNDVILQADDTIQVRSLDGVKILSNYVDMGDAEHIWEFGPQGYLTLPGGGVIINPPESSSDGSLLSTLLLVPDGTNETDQYVVIDPTAPNHIHLRAGGVQDASTADLFLGAERNNVRVSDPSNNVTINTRPDPIISNHGNSNQASNTEFMVVSGTDIIVGDTVRLYTGGDTYIVTAVTQEYPYAGLMTVVADGLSFITGESYTFTREQSLNTWIFEENGVLYTPTEGTEIVSSGNLDTTSVTGDINITAQGSGGPTRVNIAAQNSGKITLVAGGGIYAGSPDIASNEIATLADLPTGATGTFETSDSKLVTVTNGIITSIESLT